MADPQKAVAYIEIEDYLVLEEASRYKHEYLHGVIYSVQGEPVRDLAGGSLSHARIIRNAAFALHAKLRNTQCEVLSSDMRLRISDDAVFYPDVMVLCDSSPNPRSSTELTDAKLIVEVLSPSTQTFDRGEKLSAYQTLPGLRQIVLLSSTQQAAWACARGADGAWTDLAPWVMGTTLDLGELGVTLSWDDVYAGVGLN